MYIADAKRLTHDGARKMMAVAIDKARAAKIAISCCIVDAGGHVVVLERMDGGRFHTLHSCTTKAVCAASNKRATTAKGAVGQDLDVTHALGLALAAGPERWTAMEGGVPILVEWRVHRRRRRQRRRLADRPGDRAGRGRVDRRELEMNAPLRVACIGMGWWSDVLADAIKRSDKIKIVACYTRSADKRAAFAKKYGCRPAATYEEVLADPEIEAIINTTPNDVHLPTTTQAAEAGKHVFLDKPIANNVTEGRAITEVCRKAGVVLAWAISGGARAISAGSASRSTMACSASSSTPRPTSAATGSARSISSSWRYQAAGMPGGVMLQIGIHYTDVLTYLMGPVKAVRGQFAQLVLPGDNPDVASLILEHDSGALSTLNASYASASEYYLMNIYGKDATAFYDLHGGLRLLKRGEDKPWR